MPDAYDRLRDSRVSRVSGRSGDTEADAYHLGLQHAKDGMPVSKNPYDRYVPGQRILHYQYQNGHETGSKMKTEAKMTGAEMKKREEIVKSMKKNLSGFKKRYGERAKEVMYATATKQAMKEDTEDLDEGKSLSKMSDAELSSAYKDNEAKIKSMPHVPMGHRLIQRRRAIKLQQMINNKKQGMAEGTHYCAKHVYSDVYGEGLVIEGEHAEPNDAGQVEWYTVQFDHGKETVFTEDLEIMVAEYHNNHAKKKKKKAEK